MQPAGGSRRAWIPWRKRGDGRRRHMLGVCERAQASRMKPRCSMVAYSCGTMPWPCSGTVRQIEEGPTLWGLLDVKTLGPITKTAVQ